MNFPDKLKQCRSQKEFTQQNLADLLHVSRKTISGWGNGRSYPDIKLIISISDIFRISVDDLIRDDHMLSYYAEQERQSVKLQKVSRGSYVLGIILLVACYLHVFFIPGFRSPLISIFLIANSIISLSLFNNWDKFKKKIVLLGLLGTFIFFLSVNVLMNFFDNSFLQTFSTSDTSTIIGTSVGRILLDLFLALGMSSSIFFNPFTEKNRNHTKSA